MPGALKTFCIRFLDRAAERPTVNLMRKLFHTHLMKLASNEKKLKEVMLLLDAHSVRTQEKHYILREPQDDVLLAKTLVREVLGEEIPWHTSVQLCQLEEGCKAITAFAKGSDEGDDGDEEEDEELEYFPGVERFCIQKPLLAIANQAEEPLPLLDLPDEEPEEKRRRCEEPASSLARASGERAQIDNEKKSKEGE